MYVSRVSVSVFEPYRFIDRVFKVFRSYHSEYGHHKFGCDERMLFFALESNAPYRVGNVHADHFKQRFRASSDAFSVKSLRRKNGRHEFVLHFFGSEVTTLFFDHITHKFVAYAVYRNDFLFRYARKVVVESTAVYYIFRRLSYVRGLVYKRRRISRARADTSLARRKYSRNYARTSRRYEKLNILVVHHNRARIESRVTERTTNIHGSARFDARFVNHADCVVGSFYGCRMGIEYYRVACGEHSYRVTDNRFAGVSTRRNRADNSERSHFYKGKTFVSRPRGRLDVFRSGGHFGSQSVF